MTEIVPVAQWLTHKYLDWQTESGEIKSLGEFAEYLGVGRPALSMWLSGKRVPTNNNVDKIADKLGPEIYGLLGMVPPDPALRAMIKKWNSLPEKDRDAVSFLKEALSDISEEEFDEIILYSRMQRGIKAAIKSPDSGALRVPPPGRGGS